MKNEIIKRNILITLITSIVYLLLSFFIMSYSSKMALKDEVLNVSKLFISIIDDKDTLDVKNEAIKFTDNQDWLILQIADNNGLLLFDSSNDSIGNDLNNVYLKDDEIELANNLVDEDKVKTKNNTIYYYVNNGEYIITFIATYKISTTYILISIFIMLILILLEIVLSYYFSIKTSKKMVNTINDIEKNLININKNKKIDILNTDYEEVEPVIKEINKINKNLNESFVKLENERNKLLLVVNKLSEGIFILDDNLNLILINDSASNILSIVKEEVIGKNIVNIVSDKEFIKRINYSLKNEVSLNFDYFNKDTDKIYSVSTTYLKTAWEQLNNTKTIIFITFDDVTQIRRASKVKSNFISNASHELKTPITSIKGFVELLSLDKDKFNDNENKYLEVIKNESNRMVELIDELIYLSKLEEMDKEYDNDQIYLKDITFDIFDQLLENNKLNVELINECDDSYLYSNQTLIYRLLKNLIENAYKYNKYNGKVIVKSYKENGYIYYIVLDTGIGIEKKNIERIFERFYRVDKSRSSVIEGTGLGLNIVKETCELIGAKINIESTINVGTKFTITFKENDKE